MNVIQQKSQLESMCTEFAVLLCEKKIREKEEDKELCFNVIVFILVIIFRYINFHYKRNKFYLFITTF